MVLLLLLRLVLPLPTVDDRSFKKDTNIIIPLLQFCRSAKDKLAAMVIRIQLFAVYFFLSLMMADPNQNHSWISKVFSSFSSIANDE